MDRVDDFSVVDALKVDGGDAEVGVPELALDDVQRDAFTSHLDSMRMAQLMRREAPAHTSLDGEMAHL